MIDNGLTSSGQLSRVISPETESYTLATMKAGSVCRSTALLRDKCCNKWFIV